MSRRCSSRGSVAGTAQHLVVAALLVGHPEHADRPAAHQHAREQRVALQQHQRVERVAVLAERVLDEAVVGRVLRRGEQRAVQPHPAGLRGRPRTCSGCPRGISIRTSNSTLLSSLSCDAGHLLAAMLDVSVAHRERPRAARSSLVLLVDRRSPLGAGRRAAISAHGSRAAPDPDADAARRRRRLRRRARRRHRAPAGRRRAPPPRPPGAGAAVTRRARGRRRRRPARATRLLARGRRCVDRRGPATTAAARPRPRRPRRPSSLTAAAVLAVHQRRPTGSPRRVVARHAAGTRRARRRRRPDPDGAPRRARPAPTRTRPGSATWPRS